MRYVGVLLLTLTSILLRLVTFSCDAFLRNVILAPCSHTALFPFVNFF